MTTLAMQDFLSEILDGKAVPAGKLAYFQSRLSGRIHQAMLKIYGSLERDKRFTRRDLARRIGRKPEQITRWFSYPSNLTLDTVSDIFVGMGCELDAIVVVNLATGTKIQIPTAPTVNAEKGAEPVEQEHASESNGIMRPEQSNVTSLQMYKDSRIKQRDYQEYTPPPAKGTAESYQLHSSFRERVS